MLHRLISFAAVAVLAVSGGCASTGPQVNVIGVSEAPRQARKSAVVVFVEIVNPGARDLKLSRLDYEFQSSNWVSRRGAVKLSRSVDPNSTAVVEVPVAVAPSAITNKGAVGFTLKGRLYAEQGTLERSWKVSAKGALSGPSGSTGVPSVRIAVAGPES